MNIQEDPGDYLRAFPCVSSQKEVFVMTNGEVVGFDFLSLAPVYEALHQKLVKSYVMDAFLQQKKNSVNGSIDLVWQM